MTIRKWFYLFWTTLLVGAVTAIVTGLVLQFSDQQVALGGKEIGFSMLTMFLGGATISVLSQMGFFLHILLFATCLWECFAANGLGICFKSSSL